MLLFQRQPLTSLRSSANPPGSWNQMVYSFSVILVSSEYKLFSYLLFFKFSFVVFDNFIRTYNVYNVFWSFPTLSLFLLYSY